MAKFKKRRHGPTQSKEPQRPPAEAKPEPAPEAKPEPKAEAPAEQPEIPIGAVQQDEKDTKLNTLFWLRVACAVGAGTAATFLFDSYEGEERRWASIGFMIVVFIATIIYAKTMRIPFALSDRKKLVTQGIGSYIFLYLFVWIITYTLANLDGNPQVPFP